MKTSHIQSGKKIELRLELDADEVRRLDSGKGFRIHLSQFGWQDPLGKDREVLILPDTEEVQRWRQGSPMMSELCRIDCLAASSLRKLAAGEGIRLPAGREGISLVVALTPDRT